VEKFSATGLFPLLLLLPAEAGKTAAPPSPTPRARPRGHCPRPPSASCRGQVDVVVSPHLLQQPCRSADGVHVGQRRLVALDEVGRVHAVEQDGVRVAGRPLVDQLEPLRYLDV
jgi:hypothetical protein